MTVLDIVGRQAVRLAPLSHIANDTASQAFPRGVRAGGDISGDLIGPFANAVGIAEHIVWRYGAPLVRPSATVANWLPTALGLDLFDLVDVTSTQLHVSAKVMEIVGLTETVHRAAPDAEFIETVFQLQEAKVVAPFFTWDVSVWDGPDLWAY